MTSWNPSGPDPELARLALNAYQVTPEQAGVDLIFRAKRSHHERRRGWKGRLDWLLHRKPILVIDELELL